MFYYQWVQNTQLNAPEIWRITATEIDFCEQSNTI